MHVPLTTLITCFFLYYCWFNSSMERHVKFFVLTIFFYPSIMHQYNFKLNDGLHYFFSCIMSLFWFAKSGNQVVSYDFKEDRFANLHRSAIGFPESRFFYAGTPATSNAKEAALKGEELVRAQFSRDPYGCRGSLYHKKLKRDPFHRSIPYPNGCPEIEPLFRYCGPAPYPGALPWA